MSDARLFGKFRGVVVDNRDPSGLGRLRARVPDAVGDNVSGWALPCTPYAGRSLGLFMIPPVDALVWIEFEHGDPDFPIWSGGFWGQGDVPLNASPDVKLLKTNDATITIDDSPGQSSLKIETSSGLKLVLDSSGIELTNGQGKIKLSGPNVTINDALEVS